MAIKTRFFSKLLLVVYLSALVLVIWQPALAGPIDIVNPTELDNARQGLEDKTLNFNPSIDIPGVGQDSGFSRGVVVNADQVGTTTVSLLGRYIKSVYGFFVGVAAIVATFMIAVGGFMWLVSGGGDNIKKAKEIIIGAISGLILILSSYVFLVVLNPNLTRLDLAVPSVETMVEEATAGGPDRCAADIGNENQFVSLNCLSGGTCPDYPGVRASLSGVELPSVHPGLLTPLLKAIKNLTDGSLPGGRLYQVTIKSARRSFEKQFKLWNCFNRRNSCPPECAESHCVQASRPSCTTSPHIRGVAVDVCVKLVSPISTSTASDASGGVPDLCGFLSPQRSITEINGYFASSTPPKNNEWAAAVGYLNTAMSNAGLANLSTEWWHYQILSLPSPIR